MLVLSRRPDEAIVIGNDIVVSVLGVERGGQVKIGIEAPRSYRILRRELLTEVESDNREARASTAHTAALDSLAGLIDNEGADGARA